MQSFSLKKRFARFEICLVAPLPLLPYACVLFYGSLTPSGQSGPYIWLIGFSFDYYIQTVVNHRNDHAVGLNGSTFLISPHPPVSLYSQCVRVTSTAGVQQRHFRLPDRHRRQYGRQEQADPEVYHRCHRQRASGVFGEQHHRILVADARGR